MALVQGAHGRDERRPGRRPGGRPRAGALELLAVGGHDRPDAHRSVRGASAPASSSTRRSGVRADRRHPAVGDDAVERGAGQREVATAACRARARRARRGGRGRSRRRRGRRAGERGVAVLEGVVEGGAEQRPQRRGRVVDAGVRSRSIASLDQRHQVVGAVRQPGVVERRGAPRAPTTTRPPRSATSRSASSLLAVGHGHAEGAAREPGQVDGGAGERHRRGGARAAVRPARPPARAPRARGGRRCGRRAGPRAARRWPRAPTTTLPSMSSGTVSSSRSQARATSVGLRSGTPGSSAAARLREASDSAGGRDDLVAGGTERGGQHGADPTGADDADTQPRGQDGAAHLANLSFRSRRHPRGRGRYRYQTMGVRWIVGESTQPAPAWERCGGVTCATSRGRLRGCGHGRDAPPRPAGSRCCWRAAPAPAPASTGPSSWSRSAAARSSSTRCVRSTTTRRSTR